MRNRLGRFIVVIWFSCASVVVLALLSASPVGAAIEGEQQRFSLMLGLGAVSPEFIHGHIVPDPDAVEHCPPLAGQPWCGLYEPGAEVLLTPMPNEGYVFSHWTGDLSGSAVPGVVTMDADKHIKAEFTPVAEGESVEGESVEGESVEGESAEDLEPDGCCAGCGVDNSDAQRRLGDILLIGISMLVLLLATLHPKPF